MHDYAGKICGLMTLVLEKRKTSKILIAESRCFRKYRL